MSKLRRILADEGLIKLAAGSGPLRNYDLDNWAFHRHMRKAGFQRVGRARWKWNQAIKKQHDRGPKDYEEIWLEDNERDGVTAHHEGLKTDPWGKIDYGPGSRQGYTMWAGRKDWMRDFNSNLAKSWYEDHVTANYGTWLTSHPAAFTKDNPSFDEL